MRVWIAQAVRIECGVWSYNLEMHVDASCSLAMELQSREGEWAGGERLDHRRREVEGPGKLKDPWSK
jgi:hypothetical protein